jgi:hypothetical protein
MPSGWILAIDPGCRVHPWAEEAQAQSDCGGFTVSRLSLNHVRKAGSMDIMEFLSSWYFIGIMAVLLVVLIGVLLFLRSKRPEE